MSAEHHARERAGTIAAFALVALIWGSTWFVIRDQIAAVPPAWTIVWRFVLAAAGMAALAAIRRESLRLPREGHIVAAGIGFMQFFANYQFVYVAERHLTSGVVAVLYALLLVPNAAFSALWLGTRVTGRFIAGSAVAIVGIALLLLHEWHGAGGNVGGAVGLGIALSIGGVLAASLANVLQASERAAPFKSVPLMAWAMIWGLVVDVVYALVTKGPPVWDPRPAYVLGVAYLAIIGSTITFPLYHLLIRRMGAGGAAYNGVVTPVIAMLLSTAFEGYHWDMLAAAGSVLALAGLVVALSGRQQIRVAPDPV